MDARNNDSPAQNRNWYTLVPPEWNVAGRAPVLVRIYTSARTEAGKLASAAELVARHITRHPVKVLDLQVATDWQLNSVRLMVAYDAEGGFLHPHGQTIAGPPGDYLAFASPTDDVAGVSFPKATEAIESARGFMCATLGPSIAHSLAFSYTVDPAKPGGFEIWSEAIQSALPISAYAFLAPESFPALEYALSINTNDILRSRVETAFSFVGRAHLNTDETLRLMDLWTALEVVFGGYSRLAGHIDRERKKKGWRSAMLELKRRRTVVVHQGARATLTSDEQRLLLATLLQAVLRELSLTDSNLEALLSAWPP